MRRSATIAGLCLALAAGTALAHSGVSNQAVKARMGVMGVIQTNTKVLVEMARGLRNFNPDAAAIAATEIAAAAEQVPVLFRAPEDDPKSEASADIGTISRISRRGPWRWNRRPWTLRTASEASTN